VKHRPVVKNQFATLFVEPKPKIDEEGYAVAYPTVEAAIRALPKKHGGVVIVKGEFRRDKAIKFPKNTPVTLVGGTYKLTRKAEAFVEISKTLKSNVITCVDVEFLKGGKGQAAILANFPKK